jgi:hypothetical protein
VRIDLLCNLIARQLERVVETTLEQPLRALDEEQVRPPGRAPQPSGERRRNGLLVATSCARTRAVRTGSTSPSRASASTHSSDP